MSASLTAPGVALTADPLIALRRLALKSQREPVLSALPGGFASKRKGRGLEVADLREYQSGDDIRHLDRAATARTGRPHVRLYQEERDQVTLLVADFRAPMLWGISRAFLSVAAAEILSLLGWRLVDEGGRVALYAITPGAPVIVAPRGRARGQLEVIGGLVRAHAQALEALRRRRLGAKDAQPSGDECLSLAQALGRAERLCPPGAEIVIASGFDETGSELGETLGMLERRRTLQLIAVTDAEALPAGRYPVRMPDGRRLRLDLGRIGAAPPFADLGARSVLEISASLPPEESARKLAAASPRRRRR